MLKPFYSSMDLTEVELGNNSVDARVGSFMKTLSMIDWLSASLLIVILSIFVPK